MQTLLKELKELGLPGDILLRDVAGLIEIYLNPRCSAKTYSNINLLFLLKRDDGRPSLIESSKVFDDYLFYLNSEVTELLNSYFVSHMAIGLLDSGLSKYGATLTVDTLLLIVDVAVGKRVDKVARDYGHLCFESIASYSVPQKASSLVKHNSDYIMFDSVGGITLTRKGQIIFDKIVDLIPKNSANRIGMYDLGLAALAKLLKMKVKTLSQVRVLEALMPFEYGITESEIKKATDWDATTSGPLRRVITSLTNKHLDFVFIGKRGNDKVYTLYPHIRQKINCGYQINSDLVQYFDSLGVEDLQLLLISYVFPSSTGDIACSIKNALHIKYSLHISNSVIANFLDGKEGYIDSEGNRTKKAMHTQKILL